MLGRGAKKKKKNGEDGISLACALNCGYGEVALHHGLADAVHWHPGEVGADGHAEHCVPLGRVGVEAAGRVYIERTRPFSCVTHERHSIARLSDAKASNGHCARKPASVICSRETAAILHLNSHCYWLRRHDTSAHRRSSHCLRRHVTRCASME